MIDFGCKGCGRFFRVSDDKAGRKGKCPDCGSPITVPTFDTDIKLDELEISSSIGLRFQIKEAYDMLLKLKDHLGLVSSIVFAEPNILFTTFSTEDGRTHQVSLIQQADGGLIHCRTKIGKTTNLLKSQIVEILKKFNSQDGMPFHAGVDEDDCLVAQVLFKTPPENLLEIWVYLKALANFGDNIERDFLSVDVN